MSDSINDLIDRMKKSARGNRQYAFISQSDMWKAITALEYAKLLQRMKDDQ